MNPFDVILIYPIINVLVLVYKALNFFHLPYALGFSIVGLTILIRLALYPLISSQLRASAKMQKVAPHISRLKEKHKNDAKRLQQETMRLYKEHGVNPAAGCLPVIIQIPIIWALYAVLQSVISQDPTTVVSYINSIVYSNFLKLSSPWDQHFFGLSLGLYPSKVVSAIPLILLVPFLTGVFQFIQSKMMMVKHPPLEDEKQKKEKQKKDDFASAFQSQSLYIFPVMIGFFSFNFPIGLSLYWNTFTIFGILQQYRLTGWGGLIDWKEKLWPKQKMNP